ncbi:MAG: hypothetical protein WCR16_00765 [Bacilli bacterium]
MGYLLFGSGPLELPFSPLYPQASFGLYHAAFRTTGHTYVLSKEEEPSLREALWFYQNRIKLSSSYPVFNGKTFASLPSSSPEVLFQVLGLPEEVSKDLDPKKDILGQLSFAAGLRSLRRESYLSVYKPKGRKWYTDIFKMYCLEQGVFFLYDETKPFMEKDGPLLPVYFHEESLDSEIKGLIETAKTERFAIDLQSMGPDPKLLIPMQKYDSFSFEDRVDYFVNGNYHQDIASVSSPEGFRKQYGKLLREYISDIVNVLFDRFASRVLNHPTGKTSFLTRTRSTASNRTYYVLSSFGGEMYSTDGKNWALSEEDRPRIRKRLSLLMKKTKMPLLIYSGLGLPYEGYGFVKGTKAKTPSSFLSLLPFDKKIPSALSFLSAKRSGLSYSYLVGQEKHGNVFLARKLSDNGILIRMENGDEPLVADSVLTLSIDYKARKIPELAALFSSLPLSGEVLLGYDLDEEDADLLHLRPVLEQLDLIYQNKALAFFFSLLKGVSIRQAVLNMTSQKKSLFSEDLVSFFLYAFSLLYKAVKENYRRATLDRKDTLSLLSLDQAPAKGETFEPNLPYPFVSFGASSYSFRKSFFGHPYICSSEKDGVKAMIESLGRQYDLLFGKEGKKTERNLFILSKLGLPENITALLSPKKDLLPQIPFMDQICHLCQKSEPSYYEPLDSKGVLPYNIYLTYIRNEEARRGLVVDQYLSDEDSLDSLIQNLNGKSYTGILHPDFPKLDPLLSFYLSTKPSSMLALLCSFFPSEINSAGIRAMVSRFLSLGQDTLHKLFFACTKDLYHDIEQNMPVFAFFCFLFKMAERAYGVYVSEEKIPDLKDMDSTLNLDYNPRLLYPYVHLGRVYNAYTKDPRSNDFYFCSCDKESILGFTKEVTKSLKKSGVKMPFLTPMVLGMVGLPYRAILRYGSFDLDNDSPETLVNSVMEYKDGICRRCTNIAHSALVEPFIKAASFKADKSGEYAFCLNGMAHDHILVFSFHAVESIVYDPHYWYELSNTSDERIPDLYYYGTSPSEETYSFFRMDKNRLSDYLIEFTARSKKAEELSAASSGILIDTYASSPDVFYQFLFGPIDDDETLERQVKTAFPEVNRVRKEIQVQVMETILGFLTFLVEMFFAKYVAEEQRIGR